MKKILVLGIAFTFFTVAAFAQKGPGKHERDGFKTGQLTRGEKFKLHKNDVRYKKTFRKFKRDGKFNPMEKRKLYKMKRHDRRETFRFKHNPRRRAS